LLAITTDLNFKNTTATSGFIPAVEGSELDTLLDLLQPNPQTYWPNTLQSTMSVGDGPHPVKSILSQGDRENTVTCNTWYIQLRQLIQLQSMQFLQELDSIQYNPWMHSIHVQLCWAAIWEVERSRKYCPGGRGPASAVSRLRENVFACSLQTAMPMRHRTTTKLKVGGTWKRPYPHPEKWSEERRETGRSRVSSTAHSVWVSTLHRVSRRPTLTIYTTCKRTMLLGNHPTPYVTFQLEQLIK